MTAEIHTLPITPEQKIVKNHFQELPPEILKIIEAIFAIQHIISRAADKALPEDQEKAEKIECSETTEQGWIINRHSTAEVDSSGIPNINLETFKITKPKILSTDKDLEIIAINPQGYQVTRSSMQERVCGLWTRGLHVTTSPTRHSEAILEENVTTHPLIKSDRPESLQLHTKNGKHHLSKEKFPEWTISSESYIEKTLLEILQRYHSDLLKAADTNGVYLPENLKPLLIRNSANSILDTSSKA